MRQPTSRRVLRDDRGRAVLSYQAALFDEGPWADRAQPLAPHAAAEVVARLPGWRVSCSEAFGAALLAAGAQPDRHAHTMVRDLRADPVPRDWARAQPPAGVCVRPGIDRALAEVFAASELAFPAEHPDRRHGDETPQWRRERLEGLLSGRLLGPLAPGSASAFDAEQRLVGAIAVFRVLDAGVAQAWIGTVFRVPEERVRGLGETLLRRALASAGMDRMGLAVTIGNPAQALYERLGFVVVETKVSVRVPGAASN